MLDVFTKPQGEEGVIGPIVGILAGVIVGSGVWVGCEHFEIFSPMMSKVIGVIFFVIVTYNVRQAFVKKSPNKGQSQDEPGGEK